MESVSSEQDKTIARVVLAGWQLVDLGGGSGTRYAVRSPNGGVVGYRSTRYSAALLAERWLNDPQLSHGASGVPYLHMSALNG